MSIELIPVYTSLISAGSALLGLAIGSACSYFISKNQIKSTVLSGNRQQWINKLRDYIAEFQTKSHIAIIESDLAKYDSTSDASNAANHDEAMKSICLLANKISLLINPNEEDHKMLISKIKELERHCIDGDPSDREKEEVLQEMVTSIGQKILKQEWERVKKGD
jgi:ribosomal protein S15P/S13E